MKPARRLVDLEIRPMWSHLLDYTMVNTDTHAWVVADNEVWMKVHMSVRNTIYINVINDTFNKIINLNS